MESIEKENLLKIYLMLVDHAKDTLADLFQSYLNDLHLSFDDFIDSYQHDIFHLCFNKVKCCKANCVVSNRNPYVPNRILHPGQLDILLDKNIHQRYHQTCSRAGDYCCCMSKRGIRTQDLDVTLLNCLLLNFCSNLFWNCCIAKGQTLSGFLNAKKHKIFHLIHGTQICCDQVCSATCLLGGKPVLGSCFWFLLFNTSSGPLCKRTGCHHICTMSSNIGSYLNPECSSAILKELCQCRRAVDAIVQLRNKYGHPEVTSVPCKVYTKVKAEIRDALRTLAGQSGNIVAIQQKLDDLEKRSLDGQLVIQYQINLLEQIKRDRALVEFISDEIPLRIKHAVEVGTKEGISSLDGKVERLCDLLESFNASSQSFPVRDEIIHNIDHGDNDDPVREEVTISKITAGVESSIDGAIMCLPLIQLLQPGLAVVVSTANTLYKLYKNKEVHAELQDFIQKRLDVEILNDCAGMIQYYTSAIILLHGMGTGKLSSEELQYAYDNVNPLQGVELMGRLWEKIENIKLNRVKRRNFNKLMALIRSYMYLSFFRDVLLVIFCRVLQSNRLISVLRGIKELLKYHQRRDQNLIEFLVSPSAETAIFHILYKPCEWPVVHKLLNDYFFKGRRNNKLHKSLCDGHYIIKSVQFNGGPLFFANIACTWFRWSTTRDSQSVVTFEKHKQCGKTYFRIFSAKWPEYFASIGYGEWWVRGWKRKTGNDGLWEIVSIGDDKYVLSPMNSRALLLTTDSYGRLYGKRCNLSTYEQFMIEREDQFEDALEYQDIEIESDEHFEDAQETLFTQR